MGVGIKIRFEKLQEDRHSLSAGGYSFLSCFAWYFHYALLGI